MSDEDQTSDWTRIISERKIKDAIDDGVFDNLPGKGKPIIIEDDSLTPAHLRSAHRIMRNAGVAPEWIQLEKEIGLMKSETIRIFELARHRFDTGNNIGLESFREDYRQQMKETNHMILKYNMTMPFLHRGPIPFRINERLAEWDSVFTVPEQAES